MRTEIAERERRSRSPDEELLTARDLETWLKIDIKTIYGYVQKGLIPYVRIQSNVRFRRQEILAWVEQQSYRPRAGSEKRCPRQNRNYPKCRQWAAIQESAFSFSKDGLDVKEMKRDDGDIR